MQAVIFFYNCRPMLYSTYFVVFNVFCLLLRVGSDLLEYMEVGHGSVLVRMK